MPRAVSHYVDQLACLLQRISARAPRGVDHAFAQQGQLQKLTALQRKINHLIVLNDILDFRRLDLHQPGGSLYGNRLGLLSKIESEILPDVVAHVEDDMLLYSLFKPLCCDCKRVFTQWKLREQEQPCVTRDGV